MQTTEQVNEFRKLCTANDLGKNDVWQHKQSGNWIMSRTGAEKVQGRNNIQIAIEVCAAAVDYAIVKATATRTVKAEGSKTSKKISIQTLGSANPKNCTQISYYAEMAEKRAKVRAVLMLMGFYELGVYGEEEAEDFARAKNSGAPTLDEVAAPIVAPKKPEVEVLGQVSVTPTAPEAPVENAVELATEEDKKELIRLLNNPFIYRKEKNHLLINMSRLTKEGITAEQARIQGLITQRENERPVTTPAPMSVAPAALATEEQIKELVQLIASPLLDAEERSQLLAKPVDQRSKSWVAKSLDKLRTITTERTDPKKAMEAARAQLRAAAAKYASQMPDSAYDALLARAKAITAKPEELRAEARAVHAQFQAEPVAA